MATAKAVLRISAAMIPLLAVAVTACASGPVGDVWTDYDDRYAIIVTGGDTSNVDAELYGYYWADTYGMHEELLDRGFVADNIYFLSWGDSADVHPAAVDTISNTVNIQAAYTWAQGVCTADDLLYVYWVDHGAHDSLYVHTYFVTHDGYIRDDALGTMTQAVTAKQILGAYNPCFSGGIVDDLSGPGIITATSQDSVTANSWGWAGKWRHALRGGTASDPSDTDADGHVSMTEAYVWVAALSPEHPKFDDNGDGTGAEWPGAAYDPADPTKDGYLGRRYSLDGWMDASFLHADGTGDYANIQAAVTASSTGDAIVLYEGTYQGAGNRAIDYGGKGISIRSMSFEPTDTVIDCQYLDRGFKFWSGETSSATLEGVTVKRGDPGSLSGGGMHCNYSSSPTINNCRFSDNRAQWYGGAVAAEGGSSPTLTDCVFLSNYVQNAAGKGGAIWGKGGGSADLVGCTLYWNTAFDGSGICFEDTSSASISRTIIAAGVGGEAVSCSATAEPTLSCSDIYGNAGGDWSNDIADQFGASNNIRVDPLFCDAASGDLTLCTDSACMPAQSPCGSLIGALGTGCTACSVTATVTGHPDGAALCAGEPVTFTVVATGTQPLSYQWRKGGSPIGGATSTSYSIPSTVTGDAGSYDVVVTNFYGSATSNAAVLAVDVPPVVTDHPDDVQPCDGGATVFSVIASGGSATAPLGYQWRRNGTNIPGATGSSCPISPVGTGDAGDYDVVVTNVCGTDTSATATMTVHTAATISQHPVSQTIFEGNPVTFSVTATSSLPVTYQWRKDAFDVDGATGTTFTISAVTPADAGSYDLRITNFCGTVISNAATLTVTSAPSIATHPQSQAICPGDPVLFAVEATGTPPLGYQWRKNGTDILGATGSTYSIASVGSSDVANYDVVVTNAWGSATSNAAALTLGGPPVISQHPYSGEVCRGHAMGLRVMASASPPESYQWRRNGVALSDDGRIQGSATDSLTIDPVQLGDAGNFDVFVANDCGSVTSLSASIAVLPSPLYVPDDCATIQAAVDSVCPYGGVVILRDGIHTVSDTNGVDFRGKAITVRSESGDPSTCTINCMGAGRAFIFKSGEQRDSKLKNLTIINGSITGDGGAVLCTAYSNPTIENCVFRLNSTRGNGGGIACVNSAPMITGCFFGQNSALGNGGGISEVLTSAGVRDCTFSGNTAGSMGGGLYGAACGDPWIEYCTFYGNAAPTGGGICVAQSAYAQIRNCIMSFSTQGAGVQCASGAGAWLTCTSIFGNAGGDWTVPCLMAQTPPANNNVLGNPMFCAAAVEDFTISSASPCYDPMTCGLIGAWPVGCGSQVNTRWWGDTGNWSNHANWSGGEPNSFYVAAISNGGTAEITDPGESCIELWVPDGTGPDGNVLMSSGSLTAGLISIGDGGFRLTGGDLLTDDLQIGVSDGSGSFTQDAGTCTVGNLLTVGLSGPGAYDMAGGALTADQVWVGPSPCTLSIRAPAASISIYSGLTFWPQAVFSAVSGVTVDITGPGGYFSNMTTDPATVAGLESLTLLFEGGIGFGSLEVGGEDLGPVPEGLENNFALDALVLGDADVGELMLDDLIDNRPAWTGSEAQYVRYLEIGPGSSLDLNGLNLYYLTASIDAAATIIPNGGTLTQVGATPVEGSLFGSVTDAGTAMLRWTVESLGDIEGFDVLRATSREGAFTKMSGEVIAPSSPCSYEDKSVWPETTFWYEVRARLAGGGQDALRGSPISVTTSGRLTAMLYRPVPNPFSSATTLRFDVPNHASRVRLAVYNIAGRLVKTLAGDETGRGRHSVEWGGTDEHGRRVSQGVYFARLEVGAELRSQKIVVIR
ncbi:MAG: immunoglobulin domain-containing protein [Candidatus Eisenbacteria bacterium]